MSYLLSSIIFGHTKDVRCICPLQDGSNYLVSGSRDGTAKLWAPQPIESGVAQQWHCMTTFKGHEGFVSSVTTRAPDESFPNGLIYTGCQDGVIRAFDPQKPDPIQTLVGHSANVVSLFLSKLNTLLSASWDHTAKVWLNEREVMQLNGHSLGVWAGIVLPETGIMVTGSADKTIRLWKTGRCKKVLEQHTQSVRDLAVVSSTEFLSCANDHCILMFRITNEDQMDCEVVFRYEDIDYIYSLAVRNPTSGWVAAGEHIGLRVFDDGEVTTYLPVPAASVWSTCVLHNGDLVAACSDSKVYVFSTDRARVAPDDIQAVFQAEVERFTNTSSNGGSASGSGSTLPAEIGGVKIDDIPGPEALKFPGKRDGMTKMIREGNTISIHSWSQVTGEWSKVGDMITDPDKSGDTVSSGKTVFEGKEYDYVFNIDIDDNVVLKMPYNNDQDPYHVAQQFIHKNELPQSYLDEIANFIFKNASNPGKSANVGEYFDPFTGASAYTSGSGGVPTAKDFASGATGQVLDPFTGSGAYVSGSGGVPTAKDIGNKTTGLALDPFTGSGAYRSTSSAPQANSYFPMQTYLTFGQLPKIDALLAKLKDFNERVSNEIKMTTEQIDRLVQLVSADKIDLPDIQLLLTCLRWPSEFVFPCLDLVRLIVLNLNAMKTLTSIEETASDFLETIINHLRDQSKSVNQMLALKVLANFFASPQGVVLMMKVRSIIFAEIGNFLPTENKNAQVGVSTLLLNYSVVSCADDSLTEAASECVTVAFLLLDAIDDMESKFRTLVAVGTLIATSDVSRKSANDLDLITKVRTWKEVGGSEKVVNCANFILGL